MQFSLSLGMIFAVAAGVMKYTGRLTWPQLLITFTAGVLLAGSSVGLATQRAAQGGADAVQTGVSAVSGAADQAATSGGKAPAKPAAKAPTWRQSP
jgi:hypothetical protein